MISIVVRPTLEVDPSYHTMYFLLDQKFILCATSHYLFVVDYGLLITCAEIMTDKKLGALETFVIGGTIGFLGKTTTAPIERMKLLLQTQGEIVRNGRLSAPYKGAIDCLRRTYRNEGT